MFYGSTTLPDIKETKVGYSNYEVSPSTDKNTEIILLLCFTCKCLPTAISGGVDIFNVPGCHLLQQISF